MQKADNTHLARLYHYNNCLTREYVYKNSHLVLKVYNKLMLLIISDKVYCYLETQKRSIYNILTSGGLDMEKIYKAMTIAGSDASGGAGLEADLKTFQELDVYGMVAITAIVTMKPEDWSHEVFTIELPIIKKQIETIVAGVGVNAMKTGMLGSAELVELVADSIDKYELHNVVIDPVMVCKGVDDILIPTAAAAIKELLVKRATVITPNLIEAAYLANMNEIKTIADMQEAATRIHEAGAKIVIIKGGERFSKEQAIDLIYEGNEYHTLALDIIKPAYNHGAGCTYSAAITAMLAKGVAPRIAIQTAIEYIRAALQYSFPINKFTGPTNHMAWRQYKS